MIQTSCSKIDIAKEKIWASFYCFSLVFLFMAFIANKEASVLASQYLAAFAFLFSLLGFMALVIMGSKDKDTYFAQLAPIYIFFLIFWILSFLSEYTEKRLKMLILVGMVCLAVPVLWIVFFWKARFEYIKRFIGGVTKRWPLVVIVAFFVLLSLETLDDWARLDTDIYYHYLNIARNWDFSFSSFDKFRLGGHQCFGYTIWGLIGIYLTPDSILGVRIINLVLYVITIICFYLLIKKYGFLNDAITEYLVTALFSFHPLILGLMYEINLDIPSTCFYVWTLCALLYHKKISLAMCSFLLAFSKETGIILLFGIALGWIWPLFIDMIRGDRKKVFSGENLKYMMIFLSPAVLFVTLQRYGLLWRQEKNSLAINGTMMDKIGIHPANVRMKLVELLIVNFSWILTIVIMIYVLLLIYKNLKEDRFVLKIPPRKYFPIFFSTIFFVFFQFIYITYCHIRYITPFLVGFILFFSFCLNKMLKRKGRYVFLTLLAIIIIIENFLTVDFVSNLLCEQINIGKSTIITTRTFVRSSENLVQTQDMYPELVTEFGFTQSAIYNRQFSYFQDVFLECMREIGYDEDTYILLAPIYEEPVKGMTWISLFGKWYDENLYYDVDKEIVVESGKAEKMNLSVYDQEKEVDLSEYERVFLLGFPYNKNFDMDRFLERFNITDSFSVYKKLWEIDVYQIR